MRYALKNFTRNCKRLTTCNNKARLEKIKQSHKQEGNGYINFNAKSYLIIKHVPNTLTALVLAKAILQTGDHHKVHTKKNTP